MRKIYIIGEIGQNHNGSVEIAKRLVDIASMPVIDDSGKEFRPMDAIKLQKRDLKEELTLSEMSRPYDSPHSFGKTYGEHRRKLELSDAEHAEIYHYAKDRGLDVIETVCNPGALSFLSLFKPDRLKVASRDLTNLPLLTALAKTGIPIILSTGMGGERELAEAIAAITPWHQKITIFHCLSQYPADFQNLNLRTIIFLKKKYPQYQIGYSDHSQGIMIPIAAATMGAEMIEKHITLNRGMKGSDHRGALAPDGIFRMMRDIRHLEEALGEENMVAHPAARQARLKLERSLATKRQLKKGTKIKRQDLHLLSPGTGYKWSERARVIGRIALVDIPKNELITEKQLKSVGVARAVKITKPTAKVKHG